MSTHYSTDGKTAYQIKEEHPECPYHWATGARSMTTARIDYEASQDQIIHWYEENILAKKNATTRFKRKIDWKYTLLTFFLCEAFFFLFGYAHHGIHFATTLCVSCFVFFVFVFCVVFFFKNDSDQ